MMKKRWITVSIMLLVALSLWAYVNPGYQSPVINVVEATAPAVVKIDVERTARASVDPFVDEFFRRFFGEDLSPFGAPRQESSLGSGVIFDSEGHVLTNQHVVRDAEKITITMLDGTVYEAKYIGGDTDMDIAVVKIINEGQDLPFLKFGDSDNLQIGEWAIAIGNPLGFQHTVTVGVISAVNRRIPKPDRSGGYYPDLIQTDAAINPGNSGGPLLNIHGEVIGINTAIVNPMAGVNLGFAIPINRIQMWLEDLIRYGQLRKAFLGVVVMSVDENTQKALGLESTKGALVVEVSPNSPADRYGIKPQDIIIRFDSREVEDHAHLVNLIHGKRVDEEVEIVLDRNGSSITLSVVLGQSPQERAEISEPEKPEEEEKIDGIHSEVFGLSVAALNPQLRQKYEISERVNGLVITQIDARSRSYSVGLREGMVILAFNRVEVSTIDQWLQRTESLKRGDPVALYIFIPGRGNAMVSFTL